MDDPLLERAAATGVDWRDLAASQTALYAEDMAALGVIPPDVYAGVVESIPAVVEAVEKLLAAGAAYRVPTEGHELGDVYADLSADVSFGDVAGLEDDLDAHHLSPSAVATRTGPASAHPLDPLLWRRSRDGRAVLGRRRRSAPAGPAGTSSAPSSRGTGSACRSTSRAAAPTCCFPHHEMSTSHARLLDAGHGARLHVHTGMVGLDGHKMSKSLGNLVLVSTLRGRRRRPDGDPARDPGAPLPRRLGLDRRRACSRRRSGSERWRAAVSGNGGPDPTRRSPPSARPSPTTSTPRTRCAVVDAWADLLAGRHRRARSRARLGSSRATVDALLGVRLSVPSPKDRAGLSQPPVPLSRRRR